MTDWKHFPDHLEVFVPKNGHQQEFEPANSWCDTNPLSKIEAKNIPAVTPIWIDGGHVEVSHSLINA
jgi:hypothetical protein